MYNRKSLKQRARDNIQQEYKQLGKALAKMLKIPQNYTDRALLDGFKITLQAITRKKLFLK